MLPCHRGPGKTLTPVNSPLTCGAMARAPLLQLSDISLTFGGNPVFDGLSLVIQPGDRVALVGRNGSGKSTLMKVMAGLVEPDRGQVVIPAGVTVGYMEQDPDLSGFATLGDFAASRLPEGQDYRLAVVAEGLKFDPATPVSTASGGERRRAALAKLLAEAPELMLWTNRRTIWISRPSNGLRRNCRKPARPLC
jgi:ATP-binding cassette subfamily F protein uup